MKINKIHVQNDGVHSYADFVDNIIDLKTTQDWQRIIPNIKEPIVVDLYADWCGPCKKLTPKLERKVK